VVGKSSDTRVAERADVHPVIYLRQRFAQSVLKLLGEVRLDTKVPAALLTPEGEIHPVTSGGHENRASNFDTFTIVGHCDRSPDAPVFGAGTRIVNGLNHTCDAQVTA
jgi:hypothetical protein